MFVCVIPPNLQEAFWDLWCTLREKFHVIRIPYLSGGHILHCTVKSGLKWIIFTYSGLNLWKGVLSWKLGGPNLILAMQCVRAVLCIKFQAILKHKNIWVYHQDLTKRLEIINFVLLFEFCDRPQICYYLWVRENVY